MRGCLELLGGQGVGERQRGNSEVAKNEERAREAIKRLRGQTRVSGQVCCWSMGNRTDFCHI